MFIIFAALIFWGLGNSVQLQASSLEVHFSPDGGCTQAICETLAAAKQTILFQAYSFTSRPIAKALAEAKGRGVRVTAIVDKENEGPGYNQVKTLVRAGIPVLVDFLPTIAHNKVIIVDESTVITGSFNFTTAAEHDNTENLLIIRDDPNLASKYKANFEARLQLSRPFAGGQ